MADIKYLILSFVAIPILEMIKSIIVTLTILAIIVSSSIGVIQSSPIPDKNVTNTTNSTKQALNKNLPIMQIRQKPVQIECPYTPRCSCNTTTQNELTLTCSNFTNFNELDFKLPNSTLAFNLIRIIPLKVNLKQLKIEIWIKTLHIYIL